MAYGLKASSCHPLNTKQSKTNMYFDKKWNSDVYTMVGFISPSCHVNSLIKMLLLFSHIKLIPDLGGYRIHGICVFYTVLQVALQDFHTRACTIYF